MKKIVLILLLIVVCLAVKYIFFRPKVMKTNQTVETILTRSSIREYTNEPVDSAQLETILRCAMATPTAGNKQPWGFIVIENRDILKAIADTIDPSWMVEKAPVAIVVTGDLNKTFPEEGVGYWIQDCSAVAENILLSAHSLGLGAVWCGIYPISERVNYLKRLLDIPENQIPLCIIPIGHYTVEPRIKDKWNPEVISYRK